MFDLARQHEARLRLAADRHKTAIEEANQAFSLEILEAETALAGAMQARLAAFSGEEGLGTLIEPPPALRPPENGADYIRDAAE